MANLKYILTFTGIFLTGSLLSFLPEVEGRRGGDKFILGNQGPGCGPKFIFKSGSRKHKEWFILNECRDHKPHDHHDHHHHHGHHEPHVLNFPIHVPPAQHHIHQAPPLFMPHPHFLPLPPHFLSGHHGHHGHHSSFPFDSPASHSGRTPGMQNSQQQQQGGNSHPFGPGSGYHKYPRQPLMDNNAYSYEAIKNENGNGNGGDHELDNDFDGLSPDSDNGLSADDPGAFGVPTAATLRQINDWNNYHHQQMMNMRHQQLPMARRQNFRYAGSGGIPASGSGQSWRKQQSKRFANFHDRHF